MNSAIKRLTKQYTLAITN